ncbi:hypothetical protein ACRN9F_19675 [Shewanella oncorhynchi]|uniref:hypothetical protein n=1 Tax=Shewanella oncorhynchi TaxID=2726434 RepID=UPI003D7A8959
MKYLLGLFFVGLSFTTLADESPIVKKFKCSTQRCELFCLSDTGNWQKIEDAGEFVTVSHYPSGTTEFAFDRGTRGDKVTFIGDNKLKCKIEGLD